MARANPQGEYDLLQREASLAVAHGLIVRARDLFKQAEEKALRLDLKEDVVNTIAYEAILEAIIGNRSEAINCVEAALKLSQSPTILLAVADVHARTGEDAKARQLVEQAAKQRGEDTIIQSVTVPLIRALVEINQGHADKALELMKTATPYDRANTESLYTRGDAL